MRKLFKTLYLYHGFEKEQKKLALNPTSLREQAREHFHIFTTTYILYIFLQMNVEYRWQPNIMYAHTHVSNCSMRFSGKSTCENAFCFFAEHLPESPS